MNKKGQYTEIYFLLFEVLMVLVFASAMFTWTNNAVSSDAFSRDYVATDSAFVIEMLQNAPGNFIFHYGADKNFEYRFNSLSGNYEVCLNEVSDGKPPGCIPVFLGVNEEFGLSGSAENDNIVRFFKRCDSIVVSDRSGPKSSKIEGYLEEC